MARHTLLSDLDEERFATEAGRFQGACIATIVCGPGSIDQAHQPDEYITLEDLAAGEAFMRRLAEHCMRV